MYLQNFTIALIMIAVHIHIKTDDLKFQYETKDSNKTTNLSFIKVSNSIWIYIIQVYAIHIQTYNQLTLFKTLNAITVSTSLSNNGTDYLSISCLCAEQLHNAERVHSGRYSITSRDFTSRNLAFILFQTIIFIEKNECLACKARARMHIWCFHELFRAVAF